MVSTVVPGPPTSTLSSPPLQSPVIVRGRQWRWCPRGSLRPAAVAAYLAVLWRIVLAPLLLLLFMLQSDYVTTATVLIGPGDAFFAFSFMDAVMVGACNNCDLGCPRVLAILDGFNHQALITRPAYQTLFTSTAELVDRGLMDQELDTDALELATELDAGGDESYCLAGWSEWGAPILTVHGTAQQILRVIQTLELSVEVRHLLELEHAIADTSSACYGSRWDLQTFLHAYTLVRPPVSRSAAETEEILPAATINVFPEITTCRPLISDEQVAIAVDSKLGLATDGVDPASRVPAKLQSSPYWFTSSLELPSVVVSSGEARVIQSHFQAYYGRCRLRSVNPSGLFVDQDCVVDNHWAEYGLMLLNADDIPVCGTDNVCVHNYYNPLWEYVTSILWNQTTPSRSSRRFLISANVFRLRYADKVRLSALPSVVVLQLLAMGAVSLYQTMAHRRSVLLTQIWAYKCQTGHQQLVYLAQVAYHLFMTSSRYYLGLTTGTLSLEAIGNLTLCFFVFSYTLINLLRSWTGDQELDRYFRLTWEILQLGTTGVVVASLYHFRRTSLDFIMQYNGELLRKTMARGAELCDLSDSCIVFSVNLVVALAVVVAALGLIPFVVASVLRRCLHLKRYNHSDEADDLAVTTGRRWSSAVLNYPGVVLNGRVGSKPARLCPAPLLRASSTKTTTTTSSIEGVQRNLTAFERHCLGSHFSALFHDCEDFAYVTRRGVRYSSVEAVLLSGYLFHGGHIYLAPDLLLLLLARVLPDRLLRSFNFILIRWRIDPHQRTVGYPIACTWLAAGSERGRSASVAPIR